MEYHYLQSPRKANLQVNLTDKDSIVNLLFAVSNEVVSCGEASEAIMDSHKEQIAKVLATFEQKAKEAFVEYIRKTES